MKCNTMTECQGDKHLVFNIDLRVNPAERVAEVARTVVPLKERVGARHVSFNLAYGEGGATKYCNLPVYVTEDAAERVIRLLFPPDFCLTVWDGTVEVVVFGLEYHVDKRTEVVTEVMNSSTAIRPAAGRIQLRVNLSDMTPEDEMNSPVILDSIIDQVRNVHNWNLPIDLILVDSSMVDYITDILEINRHYSSLSKNFMIKARRPENLFSKFEHEIINLVINIDETDIAVYFNNAHVKDPNLIFLYENNDIVISGSDNAHTPVTNGWNRFANEIKWGHYPAVFLCSPTSERYYPVAYQFNRSADGTVVAGGVMEISYYKEVDGQMELWIERRIFQGEPSAGNTYTPGASGMGPVILKVQLGPITY